VAAGSRRLQCGGLPPPEASSLLAVLPLLFIKVGNKQWISKKQVVCPVA